MKIDVYDSFATSNQGRLMHFDVFVESGTSAQQALAYGQQWLLSIGESSAGLKQSHCNFCHSEAANPEVAHHIKNHGYFILQMEGCPAPY
ncbi:hypothetical protein GCM10011365_14050 [Marinicella pacifica]|jgi:hypothetical protein|uniref:DUF2024 family protein n=1 Tax=Marinicella pacifica TaxID=1171543 RepID=A0A917FMJ4_9GAMM|nr:DUF2024 family protein [Marinicella pacifica]GGF93971.1 hypothetical protein GCM10011365_14050 [Marinicella pacifica]